MSYNPVAIEPAYAKVNLALQLVSRLPDGFHQLDSVVAFVETGDELRASLDQSGGLSLTLDGEFSGGLSAMDNLVMRAARLLQEHAATPFGATMELTKHIPVGAGLGGGSADAAAALRLLNRLWRLDYSLPELAELAEKLGADVPACVFSDASRMEGIGEQLSPMPYVPPLALVLVYPNAPLWTPQVYGAVEPADFSGQLPAIPAIGARLGEWKEWLRHSRNDLQAAAQRLSPHIVPMVDALAATESCLLARMSGSGSACFGLYETPEQAEAAAAKMQRAHPQWWIRPTTMRLMVDAA